jgi:hypothetical protein
VVYPFPFLKYFYKAHPEKLPDGHRDKPEVAATPAAAHTTDAAIVTVTPSTAATIAATPNGLPQLKQEAPVFVFFALEKDELCGKPGVHHGKRQQVWTCKVHNCDGQLCGAKRTLTCDVPTRAPPNSNLVGHIREEAKKCPYHAAVLEKINESSKNQILQPDGSYATVFSFEESFEHHVNYVMCVAKGEISAVTGKKPMFRKYIRGAFPCSPPHSPSLPP